MTSLALGGDHPLLRVWRAYRPSEPPYVLPGDEVLLEPTLRDRWIATFHGWRPYVGQPDLGASDKGRLHLGLLPMPFAGDLLGARVYVLQLNPGLEPLDYFGEWEVPGFREALLENYAQTDGRGMLFLDPEFAWHGGFRYWHGRLSRVIASLAERLGITYGAARQRLQRTVCVLEAYPYHSVRWALPEHVARRLRSAALARDFVHDVICHRAKSGEALIIVTRQVATWGLASGPGIVVYEGMARRGAHIGPTSSGGRAILEHLVRHA